MAALIWTEPALHDLDAIADYIALDDPRDAGEPAGIFRAEIRRLSLAVHATPVV